MASHNTPTRRAASTSKSRSSSGGKKHRTNPKGRIWNLTLIVDIYALAQDGNTDRAIAKILGVTSETFSRWKAKKRSVRYALKTARTKGSTSDQTVMDFCESKLNPTLRPIWDQLVGLNKKRNNFELVNAFFAKQGKHIRQHLFCYALIRTNWNLSRACRKLGINRQTVKDWLNQDPNFAKIFEHINECKEDFYENAFNAKVVQGDTQAILHGVKTQLRKPGLLHKGFADKLDVNMNGNVNHSHAHIHKISIEELDLPIETRRVIIDAIRAKKLSEQEVKSPHNPSNNSLRLPAPKKTDH